MKNCPEIPEMEDDDDFEFEENWRREIAMEAGMLYGADAFNEAMGYEVDYDNE